MGFKRSIKVEKCWEPHWSRGNPQARVKFHVVCADGSFFGLELLQHCLLVVGRRIFYKPKVEEELVSSSGTNKGSKKN